MDYPIPRADDLPLVETVRMEFPSARNPLGLEGVGEGGAISPPAAIAPFGVRITEGPPTPARITALIGAARGRP